MNTIVFGTFDGVHPGHKSFLKAAKKLGDKLTVVIARDQNVQLAKGKTPRRGENERRKELLRLGLADKVVLGSKTHNFFRTLRTYKIDLIALGYDQKPTVRKLKKDLRRHRLAHIKIVRLRSLRPDIYKSSKLNS